MKTDINLYQPSPRRKRDTFPFFSFALLGMFIVLVSSHYLSYSRDLDTALQQLDSLSRLAPSYKAKSGVLPEQSGDKVDGEAELNANVLAQLAGYGQHAGIAEQLATLYALDVEGLYIQEVAFDAAMQNFKISGESADLNAWLKGTERLLRSENLAGLQVLDASMRHESNSASFMLVARRLRQEVSN